MKSQIKSKVINLWHIREANGMLYYALDNIRENVWGDNVRCIVCRKKSIQSIVESNINKKQIKVYSKNTFSYFLFVINEIIRQYKHASEIVTPSMHPLPFMRKQTIVIHDPFPFIGKGFSVKTRNLILKTALGLSFTEFGVVNRTRAYRYAEKLKNKTHGDKKIVYMPNLLPELEAQKIIKKKTQSLPLIIGLCGTNSHKKKYSELFTQLKSKKVGSDDIGFEVYGFESPYIKEVIKKFDYKINIIDSRSNDIYEFMNRIDILVNCSIHEGFCRPIGYLAKGGKKIMIVRTDVMEEFYKGENVNMYDSLNELCEEIVKTMQVLS